VGVIGAEENRKMIRAQCQILEHPADCIPICLSIEHGVDSSIALGWTVLAAVSVFISVSMIKLWHASRPVDRA